ncbi:MAG: hypothetical protein IKC32_02000 [Clostridia bacterium]|nr:hypothetical protein [Clostridia bacterium]
MKRTMTRAIVILLILATALCALASCGIVEKEYRLGLGVVDTEKGQIAALVLLDSEDKIVLCRIDEFDVSKGVTDSKKKQGDSYGMLSDWGSSLAEWDDQIAHLERKLIGKDLATLAEVTGNEADIKAGCTVYVGNYVKAVAGAVGEAMKAESFKSLSEVVIALTYTVSLNDGADGGYIAVASGVALSRGYLADERSVISAK